jgi:hypothetical protein
MRRFIAILSAAVILHFGVGCRQVGGKCDCGAQPGDAHMYSPTATYTSPIMSGAPITSGTPIMSGTPMPSTVAPGTPVVITK